MISDIIRYAQAQPLWLTYALLTVFVLMFGGIAVALERSTKTPGIGFVIVGFLILFVSFVLELFPTIARM